MMANQSEWLQRCLITTLFLLVAVCPALGGTAGDKADPIALVNGQIILRSTVSDEVKKMEAQSAQQGKPLSDDQVTSMKQSILERLINVELLWQESQKQKISITENDVAEEIGKLKQRFPDEKAFIEAITKMGMTEAELKEQIEKSMAIQGLIDQEITQKIIVSDQEIKEFYEKNPSYFKEEPQVRASHILIKSDDKATDTEKVNARKKIKEIQEKLKKGKDFEKLAKENSQCPSGKDGGDLGLFGRGRMVEAFENAAFALKKGEISDIVETPFGYHLIMVTDKKDARTVGLEEAKEKITGYLKQQKTQKDVNTYIEKLHAASKIEKFL